VNEPGWYDETPTKEKKNLDHNQRYFLGHKFFDGVHMITLYTDPVLFYIDSYFNHHSVKYRHQHVPA